MALSEARREARRANIVAAAQALMREKGGADFSMAELATRAGVSPATPYNLMGSKAEVLKEIVRAEFTGFIDKLAALPQAGALDRLLAATALVVDHYAEDAPFYRGLFAAAFGAEASEVHDLMAVEGGMLWRGKVAAAIASGELADWVRAEPFTDNLLRAMSAITLSWLSEHWDTQRFRDEMAYAVLLLALGAAGEATREPLRDRLTAIQTRLAG